MPTRILWDGFLGSDKVFSLAEKPNAENLYIRLMMAADDYGRFYANTTRIARECWPNSEDVSGRTVAPLLKKLCNAGLVEKYEVDGKSYIQITNSRQRTRSESLFPDPPQSAAGVKVQESTPPQSAAIRRNPPQNVALDGDVDVDVDVDGDVDERVRASSINEEIGTLPTRDGKDKALTGADMERYRQAYPGVDILTEIRKMRCWLIDNPAKRKTAAGMGRFVNSWLSRAAADVKANAPRAPSVDPADERANRVVGGSWEEVSE